VDVVMSIVFQLQPGAVLAGSYKSILFDTSIKSIDGGHVTARDGFGRALPLNTSDQDGWFRVAFEFAEIVNGSVTPNYAVDLTYTVLNGICKSSAGLERFSLPWAHRWIVKVTESKYEVEFANAGMDLLMDGVCFGGSGFSSKCGHEWMDITRTRASYEVSGSPHSVFFEWAGVRAHPDRRPCSTGDGQNFKDTGGGHGKGKSALEQVNGQKDSGDSQGQGEPALEQAPDSQAAFAVGVVAISSSCLFATVVCACALKMPVKKGMKTSSDKISKTNADESAKDPPTPTSQQARRPAKATDLDLEAGPVELDLEPSADFDMEAPVELDLAAVELQPSCQPTVELQPSCQPAVEMLRGSGLQSRPVGSSPPVPTSSSTVAASPGAWEVMEEFAQEHRTPLRVSKEVELYSTELRDAGERSTRPQERGFHMLPPVPRNPTEHSELEQVGLQFQAQGMSPCPPVANWEAMHEFATPDLVARNAMRQASCTMTTMSSLEGGLQMGTRPRNASPEPWAVMDEFTTFEPNAECRESLRLSDMPTKLVL